MLEAKKHILTSKGLQALEDELQDLKVVRRKEIAQKIKEAREQGDLSENAEYDAAKDEQRSIESRIEELENGGVRYMIHGTPTMTAEEGSDFRAILDNYVSVGLVNNIGY